MKRHNSSSGRPDQKWYARGKTPDLQCLHLGRKKKKRFDQIITKGKAKVLEDYPVPEEETIEEHVVFKSRLEASVTSFALMCAGKKRTLEVPLIEASHHIDCVKIEEKNLWEGLKKKAALLRSPQKDTTGSPALPGPGTSSGK